MIEEEDTIFPPFSKSTNSPPPVVEDDSSALLTFILLFVGVVTTTWVLWMLWGWYAVPAGLPEVSMKTIFGMDLIITFMTYRPPIDPNKPSKRWSELSQQIILNSIAFPLFALFCGWVVYLVL